MAKIDQREGGAALCAWFEGAEAPTADYVARGKMIGGFAVIAYPTEYGVSGVKTFLINQDDVVYESDLGSRTQQVAEKIQKFDPGDGWKKAE